MRFPSFFSVLAAASVAAAAGLLPCGPAAAQARSPLFTADQEACYRAHLRSAHLANHPDQKVSSIHIFRSLSERPEAENWRPNQREETIKRFRETGETSVQAFVTFRDRRGYFHNALTCNKETTNGVGCYIECDGGSFDLKRESPATVLLNNNGFVLIGGCGEEVDESQTVYFTPGKDDKVFRLESKAAAVCRAEEQRARPIRAGKPLRERFGEKEAVLLRPRLRRRPPLQASAAKGHVDPGRTAGAGAGAARQGQPAAMAGGREALGLVDPQRRRGTAGGEIYLPPAGGELGMLRRVPRPTGDRPATATSSSSRAAPATTSC